MTTTAIIKQDNIAQFRMGIDTLLEKRDYFIRRILPKLVEGRDYYTIKGNKSLGKAGAEKIAAIHHFAATFSRDTETLDSFRNADGLVVYVCTLFRNEEIVGQGRGAASLKEHKGDANKTIKMATKSSFIDAVIRSTGLSDIFTQDVETMPRREVQVLPAEQRTESPEETEPEENLCWGNLITPKQKKFLDSLIFQYVSDKEERERWLSQAESCTKPEASEYISSFLQMARR